MKRDRLAGAMPLEFESREPLAHRPELSKLFACSRATRTIAVNVLPCGTLEPQL
jgi:hypothetical protein